MMQHGQVVFNAASVATIGGIYNGPVGDANCIAGFQDFAQRRKMRNPGAGQRGGTQARRWRRSPDISMRLHASVLQRSAPRTSDVFVFRASGGQRAWRGRGGGGNAGGASGARRRSQQSGNAGGARDGAFRRRTGRAVRALRLMRSSTGANLVASLSFTRVQHIVDAEVRSMIPGGLVSHAAGRLAGRWRRVLFDLRGRVAVLYAVSATTE